MKKYLLETKWVGAGLAVLLSLLASWVISAKISLFIETTTPYVSEQIKGFLPITVENGTITEPQNTVIHKEYALGSETFHVVLNTETDELSSDDIKNSGLYVSRKFMYMVSPQKSEIRSLSTIPNMRFDDELLRTGEEWLQKNVGKYLFIGLFLMLLGTIGIASLIYAGLTQLLIGKAVAADFARTLRITTLGYLVLLTIELFGGLSINMLIKFVLIVLLNYYINKNLYQVENK